MAGIGGVSAALATGALTDGGGSAPAAVPARSTVPAFLNLPSSYAGFGNDGGPLGQVGIANKSLAIVSGSGQADGTTQQQPAPSDPPPSYPFDPQTGIAAGNTLATIAQVTERLAFAQDQGQTSVVAEVQPVLSQLTAKVNYQLFSGIGQSPLQAFVAPEVPYVFLNLPA